MATRPWDFANSITRKRELIGFIRGHCPHGDPQDWMAIARQAIDAGLYSPRARPATAALWLMGIWRWRDCLSEDTVAPLDAALKDLHDRSEALNERLRAQIKLMEQELANPVSLETWTVLANILNERGHVPIIYAQPPVIVEPS